MPVIIKEAIRNGWKAQQNNRFGEVIEWQFINSKTGEIMFRYAPKLEDEKIFLEGFNRLKRFDSQHKVLMNLMAEIDNNLSWGCGEATKETKGDKNE